MKKKEVNILINSFTFRKLPLFNLVELSKKRINKKIQIYLGNSISPPYSKFFKNYFINLPSCKDYNKKKILKILKKFKINFVIPTSDKELIFWSRYKNFFKSNDISIFISEYNSIKTCLDKLNFHKFCKAKNIPDIKILKNNSYKKKNFKLVVKERYSFEKNKPIINKNYEHIKKNLREFKNPIIQKYIPGEEISVDAYLNESFKVVGLFMRKRDYVINGESQVTSIFYNKKMESSFIKYFEALKLNGIVMMQAKIFKDKIYIIECNPRVGGASTLSIQNGLDVFFWQINKIINDKFKIKFKKGKKNRLFRFPSDYYLK